MRKTSSGSAVKVSRRWISLYIKKIQREPELGAEDGERQAEVRGEAEVAHPGIVDEPALHHVPAERALQRRPAGTRRRASRQALPQAVLFAEEVRSKAARKTTPIRRPSRRWTYSHQKMRLKPSRVDAEVHQPELGRLAVPGEQRLPVGLRERRERADERLPFDDRQARAGEPRDPAHHDDGEDEGGADEQPGGDGTSVLFLAAAVAIGHGARGCPGRAAKSLIDIKFAPPPARLLYSRRANQHEEADMARRAL